LLLAKKMSDQVGERTATKQSCLVKSPSDR